MNNKYLLIGVVVVSILTLAIVIPMNLSGNTIFNTVDTKVTLDTPNYNDFEKGQTDCFEVIFRNGLGEGYKICITTLTSEGAGTDSKIRASLKTTSDTVSKKGICLTSDGSGKGSDWKINKIYVRNNKTGKEDTKVYNAWVGNNFYNNYKCFEFSIV